MLLRRCIDDRATYLHTRRQRNYSGALKETLHVARIYTEMSTAYVPVERGHPSTGLVLCSVDDALYAARQRLSEAFRDQSGNPQILEQEWAHHDQIVLERNAAYLCLGRINETLSQDIAPLIVVISEYISQLMNTADTPIAVAFARIGNCEQQLATIVQPARHDYTVFHTSLLALSEAMISLMAQLHRQAAEFIKPALESQRLSADAWRSHGMKSAAALLAHRTGEITPGAQDRLVELISPAQHDYRGSAVMKAGWDHIGETPTGVRLGMLLRYMSLDQLLAPSFIYEQLMLPASHSLLDLAIHRRLNILLYDKPNAQTPAVSRVPLLMIAYSVRAHRPGAEADIQTAVRVNASAEQLRACVVSRLDRMRSLGLQTGDEHADWRLHHINTFLGMSSVWYELAQCIDTQKLVAQEQALAGQSESHQSLYFAIRALVQMRDEQKEQQMMIATRVLWWSRYARKANANEKEWWRWTVNRERMLSDLGAFVVEGGWMGARRWTFLPGSGSY